MPHRRADRHDGCPHTSAVRNATSDCGAASHSALVLAGVASQRVMPGQLVALVILVALTGGCGQSLNAPPIADAKLAYVDPVNRDIRETTPSAGWQSVGLHSCSSRACHGGVTPTVPIESGATDSRRVEYTIWSTHDRHTLAYDALFSPLAFDIEARLAVGREPIEAHRDARCLACHSTPTARSADGQVTGWDTQGVSCEACHGRADKWLDTHYGWPSHENVPAAQAQAFYAQNGMTWLGDPASRTKVCAGCHVGAPAQGGADSLPVRDMDHDLIAAGHPRLDFELLQFTAAEPPHWVERKRFREQPAVTWAAGQIALTEAEVRLLVDRAAAGVAHRTPASPQGEASAAHAAVSIYPVLHDQPNLGVRRWPELSSWNCFHCHHQLAAPSWRQTERGYAQGSTPGAISWRDPQAGLALARAVFSAPSGDADPFAELSALSQEMNRYDPDPAKIVAFGNAALAAWPAHTASMFDKPLPPDAYRAGVERLLAAVKAEIASTEKTRDWSDIARLCLALLAVEDELAALNPELPKLLEQLLAELAFPLDATGSPFNSPAAYTPSGPAGATLAKIAALLSSTPAP